MLPLLIGLALYLLVGLLVLLRFARGELKDFSAMGGDPILGTGGFLFLLLIWPLFAVMAWVGHTSPRADPEFGESVPRQERESLVGQFGVAATDLAPTGKVEIAGRWHEGQVAAGYLAKGTPVRVMQAGPFGLLVAALGDAK